MLHLFAFMPGIAIELEEPDFQSEETLPDGRVMTNYTTFSPGLLGGFIRAVAIYSFIGDSLERINLVVSIKDSEDLLGLLYAPSALLTAVNAACIQRFRRGCGKRGVQ